MSPAARKDLGKIGALIVVLAGLCAVEKLPLASALKISMAHIGVMSVAGWCVLSMLSLPLPPSLMDRLVLSFLGGWAALPLFVLASLASGSHGWSAFLVISGLTICALLSRRLARPTEPKHAGTMAEIPTIPLTVYLFSAAYVLWSIAIPFGSFSEHSICREFYGDGIQRFGVIYALAHTLPPVDPFYAGAPLRYYWLAFYPLAMEFRLLHSDVFDLWKCCQTWVAFFFLPGLWSIVQAVFGDRRVAWAALLLGFAFASYEAVGEVVSLAKSVPGQDHIGLLQWCGAMIKNLNRTDPDMFMGIVTRYSDQLFMEDFLYVIQNGYGLLSILLTLWLMEAGKRWTATVTLSALTGINAFLALTTFPAFALACLMSYGLGTAAVLGLVLLVYGCAWAALCQIIPGTLFVPSLILSGAATFLWAMQAGKLKTSVDVPRDVDPLWLKAAASWLILDLLLLLLLKPVHNGLALFLNYAPALPMAGAFLICLILGKARPASRGHFSLLFLLSACALYVFISWFLSLHTLSAVPAFLRDFSYRVGLEVERFNFHHKVGKLARLTWSILAGVGLAAILKEGFHCKLGRSRIVPVVICLLALPALLTTLLRPVTYRMECPVPEAAAAEYLKRKGVTVDTVILIENFRGSRINELIPVTVYYYSQWTNSDAGVGGKWADQYLPPSFRPMSKKREVQNAAFFDAKASALSRAEILRKGKIDYILARKKYDLSPLADMVVDFPGSYLYAVRKDLP